MVGRAALTDMSALGRLALLSCLPTLHIWNIFSFSTKSGSSLSNLRLRVDFSLMKMVGGSLVTIIAEQALLSELWIALRNRGGLRVIKYGRSFLLLRLPMST